MNFGGGIVKKKNSKTNIELNMKINIQKTT